MLNVAQLVDEESENLYPSYLIINPEEFLVRQENPVINFYGFQNILEPELKGKLTEIARRDFKKIGINCSLLDFNNYFSLANLLDKNKENLENLKFKNYHKFWKKSSWKTGFEGGSLFDSLGLGSIVFCEILPNVPDIYGLGMLAFLEGFNELFRRSNKGDTKRELKQLEEIKTKYENFIRNVSESKINEVYNPEAQQIINEIKGLIPSRYFNLDNSIINQELRESYIIRD